MHVSNDVEESRLLDARHLCISVCVRLTISTGAPGRAAAGSNGKGNETMDGNELENTGVSKGRN